MRPMPGRLNTVSVRMAPPMRAPRSMPAIVMTGMTAFLNACLEHDLRLGEPLGARRADVVRADDLEHRGALHVGDVGDLDEAQRDRRQDERGEALPVGRDDPRRRCRRAPMMGSRSSLKPNSHCMKRPSTNTGMPQMMSAAVVSVVSQNEYWRKRRVDAQRYAEQLDEHRRDGELDGVGGVLADHLGDRALQLVAVAEVAVREARRRTCRTARRSACRGRAALRISAIFSGVGFLPACSCAGSPGISEHDDEGDDADADEHEDQLEKAPDDVGDHELTVPQTGRVHPPGDAANARRYKEMAARRS